jgi:hypothetical protein
MSTPKTKSTPMTMEAAARIRCHEAKQNGGKIAAGSFGARADKAAQKQGAIAAKPQQSPRKSK